MVWRIGHDELLIRGRLYPIQLSLSVNRVRLPDGALINAAHEYFRVSASGEVLEWYRGPSSTAIEDCLYATNIHVVLQSALYTFTWVECFDGEEVLYERRRLPLLEAVAVTDPAFDPNQVADRFHAQQDGESWARRAG